MTDVDFVLFAGQKRYYTSLSKEQVTGRRYFDAKKLIANELGSRPVFQGIDQDDFILWKTYDEGNPSKNVEFGRKEKIEDNVDDLYGRFVEENILEVLAGRLGRAGTAEDRFLQHLKEKGIQRPDASVLVAIARKYHRDFEIVMRFNDPEASVAFYCEILESPKTYTRSVIEANLNIALNGPLEGQTMILCGVDLLSGQLILIKLLQQSRSDPDNEIRACETVANALCPGLVRYDLVSVSLQHAEGLDASASQWRGLRMRRYCSSLASLPKLSQNLLRIGFVRILSALKHLHSLNLVHLDVKSQNIFVGEDGNWDLGDFDSAIDLTADVPARLSINFCFNPYNIPAVAKKVVPEMDFVLLSVMISTELFDKDKIDASKKNFDNVSRWTHELGYESHGRVQAKLVLKSYSQISDPDFRQEMKNFFIENYKKVVQHLGVNDELFDEIVSNAESQTAALNSF